VTRAPCLKVRPIIYHHLADRVKAHVLLCKTNYRDMLNLVPSIAFILVP
jgi:hypothetical protein